jgi:hypothetical protein
MLNGKSEGLTEGAEVTVIGRLVKYSDFCISADRISKKMEE